MCVHKSDASTNPVEVEYLICFIKIIVQDHIKEQLHVWLRHPYLNYRLCLMMCLSLCLCHKPGNIYITHFMCRLVVLLHVFLHVFWCFPSRFIFFFFVFCFVLFRGPEKISQFVTYREWKRLFCFASIVCIPRLNLAWVQVPLHWSFSLFNL